jgi:hypothetical protein
MPEEPSDEVQASPISDERLNRRRLKWGSTDNAWSQAIARIDAAEALNASLLARCERLETEKQPPATQAHEYDWGEVLDRVSGTLYPKTGASARESVKRALQGAGIDRLLDKVAYLTEAILKIDSDAVALGETEDGIVAVGYYVPIWPIHKALGLVGHSAPKDHDLLPPDYLVRLLQRAVERTAATTIPLATDAREHGE